MKPVLSKGSHARVSSQSIYISTSAVFIVHYGNLLFVNYWPFISAVFGYCMYCDKFCTDLTIGFACFGHFIVCTLAIIVQKFGCFIVRILADSFCKFQPFLANFVRFCYAIAAILLC